MFSSSAHDMLPYAPDAGKFMKQGIIFCNSEIAVAVAVDVSLVLQVNLSVVTLLLYSGCKVLGSFVHRKHIAVSRGHTCLLSNGQCLMAIGHKLFGKLGSSAELYNGRNPPRVCAMYIAWH